MTEPQKDPTPLDEIRLQRERVSRDGDGKLEPIVVPAVISDRRYRIRPMTLGLWISLGKPQSLEEVEPEDYAEILQACWAQPELDEVYPDGLTTEDVYRDFDEETVSDIVSTIWMFSKASMRRALDRIEWGKAEGGGAADEQLSRILSADSSPPSTTEDTPSPEGTASTG